MKFGRKIVCGRIDGRRRFGLALLLSAAALLLSGSMHPEPHPGTPVLGVAAAAELGGDCPAEHRAEWREGAGRRPEWFFRCGTLPVRAR